MDKVTFNVDPQKPIKFGNTTINGGSVITDLASFAKYNSEKNTSSGESGVTADTSGTQKSKSGGSSSAVAARDYVSGNGFSGITDWDGENVTVGGYVIVPEYVKDGTAYVSRDAVDSAIEKVKKANGISSAEDIRDTVSGKYGSYIDKTLKTLAGRGEFTYDPETDPAYSAYKEQYEREGDRAYRKILNDNNTSVTGASGAVLSEAMAARNLYMQELTDMIPELEMNAYERYSGENDRLISTLNAVADMADNEYDRRYTASRDAYNNLISASAAENSEKQRWIENQRADEQNRIENERNANNDYYTNAQKAADTAKTEAELKYYPDEINAEIEFDNARAESYGIENAAARGFFTRSDESVLPWLSAYRTASGYSISPRLALAEREYAEEHAKKKAALDVQLGR